eukprot:8402767-Pyramimonas_sp.AAC.1
MRTLAAERRLDRPHVQEWRDRAEYFLDMVQEDLTYANDIGEKRHQQSWDEWQQEALAGSARPMHRFTKLQRKFQPTTTQVAQGHFLIGPLSSSSRLKLPNSEAFGRLRLPHQRPGLLIGRVSLELAQIRSARHRDPL